MADDIAIKVEHVSKMFKLPHEKQTSIKGMLVNFGRSSKGYETQEALKDVSFTVKKGEFFGIIGRNGGGKSTLLKLLAGIYAPTKGSIDINGKLTPFIELGVGFNPELSGRENVFLNGALLGFNRKEMEAMYEEIVGFAEIERFMDQKLKNYSSGMQVRLAFSIAIRAQTDILLIDEVLAVGDANFQKKCIKIFEELKRAGRTIVFVSHSMANIKDFCDRVLVIKEGEVVFDGNTAKAIDIYNKINLDKDIADTAAYNDKKKVEHFGTGGAVIKEFRILDKRGRETNVLQTEQKFSLEMLVEYKQTIKTPVVGAMFRRIPTEDLYGFDNQYEDIAYGVKHSGDASLITMSATMPLATGEYFLSLSVTDASSATQSEALDVLDNAMQVTVTSTGTVYGLVKNKVTIAEQKM